MQTVDPYFRIETLSRIPSPQQVIYAAMHNDYSEKFVFDELRWGEFDPFQSYKDGMTEKKCGELVVKHLLNGNKGHYGPLEHVQIILNCGWFPHSVMQQLRTHRVGVSFDVQSFRYSGQRILEVAEGSREVEDVFYLRPIGEYIDREGKRYKYDAFQRDCDKKWCIEGAQKYAHKILNCGTSEEHARGLIPFDVRQHWVVSANVRSLMHILQIRGKKDAQLEIQQFCELALPHFQDWCPQIYEWFANNLWLKGRLAP